MTTLVQETTLDDVPEGRHVIVELNGTGDTKHIWNPDNEDEVAGAEAVFDSLKAKGYQAYKVTESGAKGEIMRRFDPTAAKLIMAPALRGG